MKYTCTLYKRSASILNGGFGFITFSEGKFSEGKLNERCLLSHFFWSNPISKDLTGHHQSSHSNENFIDISQLQTSAMKSNGPFLQRTHFNSSKYYSHKGIETELKFQSKTIPRFLILISITIL